MIRAWRHLAGQPGPILLLLGKGRLGIPVARVDQARRTPVARRRLRVGTARHEGRCGGDRGTECAARSAARLGRNFFIFHQSLRGNERTLELGTTLVQVGRLPADSGNAHASSLHAQPSSRSSPKRSLQRRRAALDSSSQMLMLAVVNPQPVAAVDERPVSGSPLVTMHEVGRLANAREYLVGRAQPSKAEAPSRTCFPLHAFVTAPAHATWPERGEFWCRPGPVSRKRLVLGCPPAQALPCAVSVAAEDFA